MKNAQDQSQRPEAVVSCGLFAVGDRFTFVGQSHAVAWTIEAIDGQDVIFGSPDGGLVKPPLRIHATRLIIGINEGRASKVGTANAEMRDAMGEKKL